MIDLPDLGVTYAAALDALPIVAYLARPDGSISFVSARWASVIGTAPRAVLEGGYPALGNHPRART